MFANLNLQKKIRIKTRISQLILVLLSIFAVLDYFNFKFFNINWNIAVSITGITAVISTEFIKKWIMDTISNPIHRAVINAGVASSDIVKSTEQQETMVSDQLALLKDTSKVIEKLSISSQQTKIRAQKVAEKTKDSLVMSSKEQEAVTDNIEKMMTLRQKIQIIAELILELSEHTQQIGSTIGVVEDITEQTNMLALNAAVEAARAGEHGKGFAVVASEIRKLADESKQATTKITSLIHDIQQATNSTVMATEEGSKEIESGVELAYVIARSIDELRNTINTTVEAVQDIVDAADHQTSCTTEVSEAINSINQGMINSVGNIKQSLLTLQNLTSLSKTLHDNVLDDSINNDFKNDLI